MKKEKKEVLILISLFLILNLYKIIFSLFFSKPTFDTPQDLFSTLYAPAYYAGLDWHEIGSVYSEYYGYGFFSLFSFLFKLTTDGMVVYRILVLICNLLSVFSCIICFKIIKEFNLSCNSMQLYFISIVCVSFQHIGEIGVANEYPLNLCVWMVVYILMLLCKEEISPKRRMGLTILLSLLLIYSCTVHARAIILFALIICCILYMIIKRKRCIVSIQVALTGIFLLIPYKIYTDYLQSVLLGKISLNSTVATRVMRAAERVFVSPKMIYSALCSVIFYCHETVILSAGIAVLCIATILYMIFWHEGKKVWNNMELEYRDKIFCGLVFSITGIAIFIAGLCYTWMNAFYEGIYLHMREYLRGLTLTRYYTPFIGPAVCFTIILLMKTGTIVYKNITRILLVILLLIQMLFFFIAYPAVKFTGWAGEQYVPFTLNQYKEPEEIYLTGILVVFLMGCFIIYALRRNKWTLLMVVTFIHLVFGQSYVFWDRNNKDVVFKQVDGGYEYFKGECGKKIYVYEENSDNNEMENKETYYFLYQLLLPQNNIIPLDDIEKIEQGLILTGNGNIAKEYDAYCDILQLDENEWLLMK